MLFNHIITIHTIFSNCWFLYKKKSHTIFIYLIKKSISLIFLHSIYFVQFHSNFRFSKEAKMINIEFVNFSDTMTHLSVIHMEPIFHCCCSGRQCSGGSIKAKTEMFTGSYKKIINIKQSLIL